MCDAPLNGACVTGSTAPLSSSTIEGQMKPEKGPKGRQLIKSKMLQLEQNMIWNCKENWEWENWWKKELKMNADCMPKASAVHGLNDIRRRGRLACESHLSELPRMGHRWQWGAARSCFLEWPIPKRPKARGLAQYGGPPGWLEESNPADLICYERAVTPPVSYRTGWLDRSCPAVS